MGVDHSAFVCYGVQVSLKDGAKADDLDDWLGGDGRDLDLGYVEWGSRSYNGRGGFLVGDRLSSGVSDFDDASPGMLAVDNPPSDTLHRLKTAVERGAPFTLESGIGWWFGGHTW